MEDIAEDLFFGYAEMRVFVIRMRTCVNDPVHIQVEIVELGDLQWPKNRLELDESASDGRGFSSDEQTAQKKAQIKCCSDHLMFFDDLAQTRISFTNPAIKLRNTHRAFSSPLERSVAKRFF